MQDTSSTAPTLVESFNMIPMSSATIISDLSTTSDTSYSSLLYKKKLTTLDSSSSTTDSTISHDTINTAASLIKPSSTTLSTNENELIRSSSRRRKPLRPWSLSARVERPNSTVQLNNDSIEPISDYGDDNNPSEMKYSPDNNEIKNSNLDEDDNTKDWPKRLSTIEEILKLYRVETTDSVRCTRCDCHANQDNLLEHVSVHYPYKCYSCGFYCDSLVDLDEHNQTHTSNALSKSKSIEENSISLSALVSTATKSSEIFSTTNSEKSTSSNKTKVHRCRQCSYVSSVKEDYWAHHRVHIRADKILECPSCPFVTEYKHHLEYHLRNHLGSKPFKCSKCEYACVNLSMLRSHKKSHFRHLLFKCSNCSFESRQYPALQEHLQIEGHEPFLDDNIEEFLKEYSNGNLTLLSTTNHNSNSSLSTPLTFIPTASIQKANTCSSASQKRKTTSNTVIPLLVKRRSSISSIDSSAGGVSPISNDEYQTDLTNQHISTPSALGSLACSLCDYVAASKEGLGVHLFQHTCKKSDLLNRSFLTGIITDPTAKLIELFNGKFGSFTTASGSTAQLNDFLGSYQQFLTQQIQSHLLSTSGLSSISSNVPHYHVDNNNNHTLSSPYILNSSYSLLSSCIKNESNENSHSLFKRQPKEHTSYKSYSTDGTNDERNVTFVDQQTQVDEWQIKRLFECFHCEIIFKDFAMYCTHKQLHYSPDNPFRCAQCGEQKSNKYDFSVHVAQQAHDLT